MKNNFKTTLSPSFRSLFKKVGGISLSSTEKEAGLKKLQALMMNEPLTPTYSKFNFTRGISFFSLNSRYFLPASAFVLCLLVVGGTTSFAAEGALPGDLLYPIKIHVNDEVRVILAVGTKKQAQVTAAQASARIQEVEQLAKTKSLTKNNREEVELNFSNSADKTQRQIGLLNDTGNASDAAALTTQFKDELQKNRDHLIDLSNTENNKESKDELIHVVNVVNDKIDTIDKALGHKNGHEKK